MLVASVCCGAEINGWEENGRAGSRLQTGGCVYGREEERRSWLPNGAKGNGCGCSSQWARGVGRYHLGCCIGRVLRCGAHLCSMQRNARQGRMDGGMAGCVRALARQAHPLFRRFHAVLAALFSRETPLAADLLVVGQLQQGKQRSTRKQFRYGQRAGGTGAWSSCLQHVESMLAAEGGRSTACWPGAALAGQIMGRVLTHHGVVNVGRCAGAGVPQDL